MSKLEDIQKSAFRISIDSTIEFLDVIHSSISYTIISSCPLINKVVCTLEKGNRCFNFSIAEMNNKISPISNKSIGFGLLESFQLLSEKSSVYVTQGAKEITRKIGEKSGTTGELWFLETSKENKKNIWRTLIPIPTWSENFSAFVDSKPFLNKNSIRVAGFINLNLKNCSFGLYDQKINNVSYLFIESYEKICFNEFEKVVFEVIFSFGLLSSFLIRDEIYFLEFDNVSFNEIISYKYKHLKDSLQGLAAVNPDLLKAVTSTSRTQYVPISVFQNMVNMSLDDKKFSRAIRIITKSSRYSLEIKASTYSVALETLREILANKNDGVLKPIKSKSAEKLIKRLIKKIISLIDDKHFNNRESLAKKIDNLNNLGNMEGFISAFVSLNLELTKEDKECLKSRNDFLHGKLPFENENPNDDFELRKVVYKLHYLLSILILKRAGYKGQVLNNIALVNLDHYKKELDELLFREI